MQSLEFRVWGFIPNLFTGSIHQGQMIYKHEGKAFDILFINSLSLHQFMTDCMFYFDRIHNNILKFQLSKNNVYL